MDSSKLFISVFVVVLQRNIVSPCFSLKISQNGVNNLPRWRLAPTRREQDKWDRARKAATGGSVLSPNHQILRYLEYTIHIGLEICSDGKNA